MPAAVKISGCLCYCKPRLSLVFLTFLPAATLGQDVAPVAKAARVDQAPAIDGRLSEALWQRAEVISQFQQKEPEEGRPATETTLGVMDVRHRVGDASRLDSQLLAAQSNRLRVQRATAETQRGGGMGDVVAMFAQRRLDHQPLSIRQVETGVGHGHGR